MKTIFTTAIAVLMSSFAIAQQEQTLTLQPNAAEGKDAMIWYIGNQNTVYGATNDKNYGTTQDNQASAWTWNGGNKGERRSLIEFDFSSIPANATIIDAKLSLYHNANSGDDGHSQLSGSNEITVQKVTQAWKEDQVTWNNQPTTTTDNQVEVPKSTSSTQNYEIVVKDLVQTMLGQGNNNGFMIQMVNKNHFRNVVFASSDNSIAALHPKIEIEYQVGVITDVAEITTKNDLKVYPNPFSTSTTFDLGEVAKYTIVLYTSNGEIVKEITEEASQIEVSRENLSTGLYFYQVTSANGVATTGKLIVE